MTNEVLHKINHYLRCALSPMCMIMFALIFTQSCSNNELGNQDEQNSNMGYMAITTRAQGATSSLNQDTQDFEDKVERLRLMAFEHATGKAVYNKVHPIADFVNYVTLIPMRTGTYDFCFVANEDAALTTALDNITFQDGLYYDNALTKIAYLGVNDKPSLFLMTAQLQGTVQATNTQTNPLRLDVELVRCLAKVNINMDYRENMTEEQKEAAEGLRITAIKFKNLPSTYSLFPPKSAYNDNLIAESDFTTGVAAAQYSYDGTNPVLRKAVYVPEYLRASDAPQTTESTIEIHYNKHGIDRKLSEIVIDHQAWNQTADTYTPSIHAMLSKKSIVRNTSYVISGILEGWSQEMITFNWEIMPWTLIKSEKEFAAVHVTTEIDTNQPNLDVQGDDGNELLWHSGAADGLKLLFNINAPAGGVWRFTITNRNDFELKGRMIDTGTETVSGIAGSGPVQLTITPTKPWGGYIRSTELYLTINGVEVQIVPELINQGVESGPSNRFIIKQVN